MFKKVLFGIAIVALVIWFQGDRLTQMKNAALGDANKESSYATRGDDGWG
ncbi:MAG: hypothetical protein PHE36_07190 [Novosphingobium sp.]|nr:hypothetical protein [Novosphingobium sp.]